MKAHKKILTANSVTLGSAEHVRDETTSENVEKVEVCLTEDECNDDGETEENVLSRRSNHMQAVYVDSNVKFCNISEEKLSHCYAITGNMESDMKRILGTLFVKGKHSVVIVGPAGSGKSTLVNVLAHQFQAESCPKIFKENYTVVYSVDVSTLSEDKDGLVSEINYILSYAESKGVRNVIIYMNDICQVPLSFRAYYSYIMSNLNISKFNMFKFIFEYNEGMYLTEPEVMEIVEFLKENAVLTEIKAPDNVEHICTVMEACIKNLEEAHGVYFKQDAFKFLTTYYYGRNFLKTFNYNDFLNVVDEVLSNVQVAGCNCVFISDIMKYYRESFKTIRKLPKDYVRATAIHETGHILLSLYAKKLLRLHGAVIIFDIETGTEAVTCIEKTEYTAYSKEDELTYVAMLLAGRAAEIEYCGNVKRAINIGAEDDVKTATNELRNWVLHSGMYKSIGYQYYDAYENISSYIRSRVDKIVKQLMKESFKIARRAIRNNNDFIQEMSEYLLRNYSATAKDIKKIANKTIKKNR